MERCKTLMPRGILPKRQNLIQAVNENRHEASPETVHPKMEDDSIWLYNVLDTIGANDGYRNACQQLGIKSEILENFQNKATPYYMGSTFEGTTTPGATTDLDIMRCDERFPVVENKSDGKESIYSLLIRPELNIYAGYVKLQLLKFGKPCTFKDWTILNQEFDMDIFFYDEIMDRIVLCDCTLSADRELFKRPMNKPSDVTTGKFSDLKTDNVVSYQCKTWQNIGKEYFRRNRLHGWPTNKTIENLKTLGFFVVRKGHPFSSEIHLQWRISLSLQERKLIFNLSDVQHKCYIILKMFNRDIIQMDCITTYHWKTCLFYVIEDNEGNIWKKELLLSCIKLCIKQMLKWVKIGFCPNYFIPEENLFDGRLNSSKRLLSENILEEMLNIGFDCFLLVKTNNICDYVRSRESSKWVKWLHANSTKEYKKALFIAQLSIIQVALSVFNHEILEHGYCLANNIEFHFLESLMKNNSIRQINDVISSNTTLERKRDNITSLLSNTILDSNITAMAFQNPKPYILEHNVYLEKERHANFVKYLRRILCNIQPIATDVLTGSSQEKTHSLSLLLPFIYTCLASNISVLAINNPKLTIRDFLLNEPFTYFMKGELPGYLKFISVLYAAKLYKDCEWYIDKLDEEYIKHNPSLCRCRYIRKDINLSVQNIVNTSTINVSTCISFLPTELLITPDAMKYEMFRYVGISLDENEKNKVFGRWHYRAVVDSNVFFFLLKYLIKIKLERVQAYEHATNNIINLLEGTNLRHYDVALNVLAWIFFSNLDHVDIPTALLCSTLSWWTMNLTDICFALSADNVEMKRKQYLYNAAKIYTLVILYNTWFEKKRSSVHFCFQCFCESPLKLPKCSECKVSTYCDKECQKNNWKIHEKTCKIVRKLQTD